MFLLDIPPDVNYNPAPFSLPDHFLKPAPPPIDAEDWPMWRTLQAYLPAGRRAIALNCRRNALHIAKDGPRGSVESINPIACGDRAACPRCAIAYAHERFWAHFSTLGVVAMTQKTPVHLLEFRASIPEWSASIKVAGCDASEVYGRLCIPSKHCGTCDRARPHHDAAARVERELSEWILNVWKTNSPHSGGVRHTRIEQRKLSGPIELVITLHVPAVSVKTSSTRANLRPDLAAGQMKMFELPNIPELAAEWSNFVSRVYQGVGEMKHAALRTPDEIDNGFRFTHESSITGLASMLDDLPAGTTLPPNLVPDFVRAVSLATTTTTGRARRLQRSAWFGCLTGSSKIQVLNRLSIEVRNPEPHATVRVLDHMRILDVGPDEVTVQSTRTAAITRVPRSMVRLAAACDILGRPTTKDPETWGSRWKSRFERRAAQKAFFLSRVKPNDAGGVQIARSDRQSSPPPRQSEGVSR